MPRKMARQTLERHAGACCAGSRPYLGSGLLGSPENHYNLPHFRVHPGNPGLEHLPVIWGAKRFRLYESGEMDSPERPTSIPKPYPRTYVTYG